MKIAIIGAGPAGLYSAYLLKKWLGADVDMTVVEQNPADATFGFGVVFSDQALEFLRQSDPETHDAIVPHMERWDDLTINVKGQSFTVDGFGFTSIGRLELLMILQSRLRSLGVEPQYNRVVTSLDEFADADLIIATDGVNSIVRNTYQEQFGTSITLDQNKFIWYGTTKPYDTLSQTFRENSDGEFNVHHYRYAADKSTFLVETNPKTWRKAGFEHMSSQDTKAYFEELFAPELDGHPIVENNSTWRNFPVMTQRQWSFENKVLLGDALHTAHFSIGSGTRLALEDAAQLVRSLREQQGDIARALLHYESERRPLVEKLVKAANTSLAWYSDFGERMKQDPFDFVRSYIGRSGRIDDERARKISPGFMRSYDAYKAGQA